MFFPGRGVIIVIFAHPFEGLLLDLALKVRPTVVILSFSFLETLFLLSEF